MDCEGIDKVLLTAWFVVHEIQGGVQEITAGVHEITCEVQKKMTKVQN